MYVGQRNDNTVKQINEQYIRVAEAMKKKCKNFLIVLFIKYYVLQWCEN